MKRIFLYSAGLLLLAAGCTKIDKVPSGEEWVWNESLPVPISFESGGGLDVETKAAINTLEGVDIGLFALSVDKSNNNQPNWNFTDASTRLLVNEKVQTDDNGTIVVKDKYYPNDNKYNYSFFAYAPYKGEGEGYTYATDWEGVYFTLGDVDIIYGESHAAVLGGGGGDFSGRNYGFKASYIRFVKSMEDRNDLLPNMKFRHVLTGLSFYAQVVPSDNNKGQESNMAIKAIKILKTTDQVRLIIADKTVEGNRTGSLSSTHTGDIDVKVGEDVQNKKLLYGDYNESVGPIAQVFLFPGDTYEISVTYEVYGEGETVIKTEEVTATIDRSAYEGFAAGNNYSVRLKITSPENIEIFTDLDAWKDRDHGEVPME